METQTEVQIDNAMETVGVIENFVASDSSFRV